MAGVTQNASTPPGIARAPESERRRVVVISPYLPSETHAGGRLLARHLAYLACQFSVALIGTRTEENQRLLDEGSTVPTVLIDRGSRGARLLVRAFRGICFASRSERELSASSTVRELLLYADIVELQ